MYFMFSSGEHEWMAVRDVHELDGKSVTDPFDVKKALIAAPQPQLTRQLKAYSSRYNIGTIVRNFGEPTFSLMALDANYRGNFGFAATRIVMGEGNAYHGLWSVANAGAAVPRTMAPAAAAERMSLFMMFLLESGMRVSRLWRSSSPVRTRHAVGPSRRRLG
jgi:hypothetical protein